MLVQDIVRARTQSIEFVGFLDEERPQTGRLEALGAEYLGSQTDAAVVRAIPRPCQFTVAIGNGAIRETLRQSLSTSGLREATLIHPSAVVGADVEMAGGVVCAGSVITTNVHLGHSTQINLNCTLGHDVTLGAGVTTSPGVNISGNVTVGAMATIHTNAAILPGITIGAKAIVGAGAVVVNDIDPGITVVGIPAKPLLRN